MVLLVVLVASIFILMCVPPVSRDALIHHLAIPKLYLEHGGIYEIPSARFSYYPMNLDLLYLIPLYFGNDIAPKFIHFAFGLLTAWLIFCYLRNRCETSYALLGVLFFLSLPVIVKLSITVYVDLGLIFFSTASLISFFKWFTAGFKWKHLVISAICCGLALGTKYTGLIGFFLMTLFVVFIYVRSTKPNPPDQLKALWFGAAFMLVALLLFSPWAIRNYIWTNNPIYPLYNNSFNGRMAEDTDVSLTLSTTGVINESDVRQKKPLGRLSHFAVRKVIFNEKWWEIALIPVRIFFQGKDDDPKYFDGKLNPALFFLPFFAFVWIRKDPPELKIEKKILLAFSILFILFAFVQRDMRIRYVSPAIPPLVWLSILGLKAFITAIKNRFTGFSGKIYSNMVYLIVLGLLCQNALYIVEQFRHVEPIRYITGEVERDEYIEKYRPEYAALKFANQNIPYDAKILGFFLGNRGYYSKRELIFDYNKFFWSSLNQNGSEQQILSHLKNAGITHLIIRYDLFENWINNHFNENQKRSLNQFFKNHIKLLFSKSGYGLFEVVYVPG